MSKLRGTVDLVGHSVVPVSEIDPNLYHDISNLIIYARTEQGKWIEDLTGRIGHWRSVFRSTYMQWAIAINGLHLGAEKYSSDEWKDEKGGFTIGGLTADKEGMVSRSCLLILDGNRASRAHLDTIQKMCVWGFIEQYAILEEFVFDFFESYLWRNPSNLIKGPEFKKIRKAYQNKTRSDEADAAWKQQFEVRLGSWRRKALYKNLGVVFENFIVTTGLEKPKNYTYSNPKTWAESVRGIGLLRNHLVHGNGLVSEELDEFCTHPYSLGFSFKNGESIDVNLQHLQCVELFTHQLLNALNMSLIEHRDAGK